MITQDEKELVIKDLRGRLQHGLIIKCNDGFRQSEEKLVSIDVDNGLINYCWCVASIKPYLRPMSSMTDEENNDYFHLCEKHLYRYDDDNVTYYLFFDTIESIDWLNKKMFDYHGLIEKGLAEIAPEGMYENESDSVTNNSAQITIGCKIRSKTNPNVILSIISDDCHEDEFECSNGSVLSLKQIEKYYNLIK